jgi:flagellar protein FliJ
MRERRVAKLIGARRRRLERNRPQRLRIGSDARACGGRRRTLVQSTARPGRAVDEAVVASPHFTFRLERVRALRERAEDLAKEEYASSLAHRLEGAAMLRATAEHRDRARAAARPAADDALSGTDLLASQAWLERLERARQAAELELDRRDAEVEARRTALVHAARERHALERLHQRRRDEHALESARREGAELDELALAAHRRRSHA